MRYLKVTLLIGFVVSLALGALYELGTIRKLDEGLAVFLGRSGLPPLHSDRMMQYSLLAVFAFGIAWTTIDISRTSLKCIVAGAALVEALATSWIVDRLGGFFSPFVSVGAIIGSFAAALLYANTQAGRRKKVVHAVFGNRVSPQVFNTLVNSSLPLRFNGEVCEATILTCELCNYQDLADTLEPQDFVEVSNAFLRTGAEFLVERGGYLDHCDGDSLRVVFGAPIPNSGHTSTACEAALGLAQRLDDVSHECAKKFGQTLDFRIGVNSGEVVAAAYGSERLGSFSIAGEAVEFSRRLCAANNIYGSRILIGTQTFAEAEPDVEVRPIEILQRYADRPDREEIYELIALRHALSEEDLERRDLFWKAVVYYREQRWDEALLLLYSARGPAGSDGPVEFYIRRIEQLRAGVPSLDWQKPQSWAT